MAAARRLDEQGMDGNGAVVRNHSLQARKSLVAVICCILLLTATIAVLQVLMATCGCEPAWRRLLISSRQPGGDTIQELLKNFSGALVSDFYAAYDGIECPGQKTLNLFHQGFE